MSEWSNKSICVVDCGLFVELAVTLSRSFAKTYYWSPWESPFPKSNARLIGEGIEGVTRVHSVFDPDMYPEVDMFVFPDVYMGALQVHLVEQGKRVWGARMGEELELCRVDAKKHFAKLGLAIGPYKVIKGLDNLRSYLEQHDNQYIKVSGTRGDFETFRADNYELAEPKLDELEHNLGAMKKIMEFVVEEAIDDAVEIGYDGYCIDGKFPETAMRGIEIKDKGFIMKSGPYDAVAPQARDFNQKLSRTLAEYEYRGFWSSEIRVTKDGTGYITDPCARAGSPPNELYQVMVSNWPEIMWHGSVGELVEPKLTGKWGAELLIISEWAQENWQAIRFPKQYAENIKLRNLTIIDGKPYVVPQLGNSPEIGAVVAVGDTKDEAVARCKEIAETVEGYYVETIPASLDQADEEMAKLKEFGIDL